MIGIGVTGHRPDRLPVGKQAALRDAIASTLVRIRDGAGCELTIISALAEGADRFVAQAGVEAGYRLTAILPFAPERYIEDFETEDSRTEFRDLLSLAYDCTILPGTRSDPDRAYAAAGTAVVDRCDALIAVWDGRPGATGGTADTVKHALAMNRPVLRFDECGNGPVLLNAAGNSPGIEAALALITRQTRT